MTLGAIAELRVVGVRVLDDAVMHRVAHAMMKERMRAEQEVGHGRD